ncbi:MAG: HEAT repeat domain-containing protein [Candidatus Eisenbacteria bacterium]|uniref:HEAT repeat domain-containing protein n=1 Tax=Eiseniibacteriota bacterium TaxID=2212470 RepID=A0A956NBE0_UNCEI|nr:HEAT repeat domain-containing protein [Candidatus Eisenbacteria bacterium]MCB9466295.1 HEAT repeat domain-containing protein [Candidatus Eisenbacteria bacterium]
MSVAFRSKFAPLHSILTVSAFAAFRSAFADPAFTAAGSRFASFPFVSFPRAADFALASFLLTVVAAFPAPATADGGPLRSIDVYGTSRLHAEDVRAEYGEELARLAEYFAEEAEEFEPLRERIETELRGRGPFAWLAVSLIESYTPDHPIQITIDVVEDADVKRRMPFREAPDGEGTSPGDARELLEAWKAYEQRSGELFRAGELPSIACEAHHCLWGFQHEELQPYGERFDREAPEQRDALLRVLRHAPESADRAAAAFLLGHLPDAQEIVDALLPCLLDPSSWVRNNSMRVLAQISRQPIAVIPAAPVIAALDYPTVRDRNKALAIVRNLTGTAENRAALIRDAGDTLLALLRLEQTANHKNAHLTLTRLAGQDFGEREYEAWEAWLAEERRTAQAE